jgi:hypothetical protein
MKKAELRRMNMKTRNVAAMRGTQAVEAPRGPRAGLPIVDKPPVAGKASQVGTPDPEVRERAERRHFSAECSGRFSRRPMSAEVGAIGALLRREGLHSSHLTTWRQQRKLSTTLRH